MSVVKLRPMVDADRELIEIIDAETTGNTMANVVPRSPEQFEAHWCRVLSDPDVVSWVIACDGASVGYVTTFVTDVVIAGRSEARRCVGYRIGVAHWGRGVATLALRQMLVVETRRPLWAVTAAANAASQRVLTKCGFEAIETRWSEATVRYPAGNETVFRLA